MRIHESAPGTTQNGCLRLNGDLSAGLGSAFHEAPAEKSYHSWHRLVGLERVGLLRWYYVVLRLCLVVLFEDPDLCFAPVT